MVLESLISLTAVITSMIVTASPLPLMYHLYKKGGGGVSSGASSKAHDHGKENTDEGTSMSTYVAMLLNNALSLWYGYYLGLAPMIAQRGAASLLSVSYVFVILRYGNNSNKKLREDLIWVFGFIFIMIFLAFDVFYYRDRGSSEPMEVNGQHENLVTTTTSQNQPDLVKRDLGLAFGFASAFFNASPLLGLREAFQKMDANVFPACLCFANWISCTAWFILGIMEHSTPMIVSQGWGAFVTTIQVAVIIYLKLYPGHQPTGKQVANTKAANGFGV